MEAESRKIWRTAEEFGPGKVVGIFLVGSWRGGHYCGEYKGGTLFNEKFPNYAVSSIEELDEFIEGKYEETYGSACVMWRSLPKYVRWRWNDFDLGWGNWRLMRSLRWWRRKALWDLFVFKIVD